MKLKRWIWAGISIDFFIVVLTLGYVFGQPSSVAASDPAVASTNSNSISNSVLVSTSTFLTNNSQIPHQVIQNKSYSSIKIILEKIAHCESQDNPLAKNPTSTAKGLLQILDSTWNNFQCDGDVYNPDDNMRCGIKIATESGLQHWNASRACWIKQISSQDQENVLF